MVMKEVSLDKINRSLCDRKTGGGKNQRIIIQFLKKNTPVVQLEEYHKPPHSVRSGLDKAIERMGYKGMLHTVVRGDAIYLINDQLLKG